MVQRMHIVQSDGGDTAIMHRSGFVFMCSIEFLECINVRCILVVARKIVTTSLFATVEKKKDNKSGRLYLSGNAKDDEEIRDWGGKEKERK